MPAFLTKDILKAAVHGAVDRMRFDAEVVNVNARFSPLPEGSTALMMADITVNGFEMRRAPDGLTLRFGIGLPFARYLGEWLADCGTDMFLLCDSSQPELPGMSEGGPLRRERTVRLPAKTRAATEAEAANA
ncbi:MAG: hypothetical protein ACRD1M_06785 [Terriglobales bacterium]